MKPADPDEKELGVGSPGFIEVRAVIRKAMGWDFPVGKLTLRQSLRWHRKAVRMLKSLRGDPVDLEEEMLQELAGT